MNQLSPLSPQASLAQCRAVALLVDGENLPSDFAGQVISATRREIGQIAVLRVYGDTARLNGWLSAPGFRVVHAHAGKNVTDILLAVEAMELSFAGHIDGFAFVTGDQDFAPLAWSLRARGFPVLGLLPAGKAPEHLLRAFTKYALIDLDLSDPKATTARPAARPIPAISVSPVQTAAKPAPPPTIVPAASAPPCADTVFAAVREVLKAGPRSAQVFGTLMTQKKVGVPKGYAKWRSWLSANASFVQITGKGAAQRFELKL